MEQSIIVQDFVKKYGKYTAVDQISFTVDQGSIFAFLGPNGAGKSTTIQTLCTILEKTSGRLQIDGKDVDTQKADIRSCIGVVFQESTLDSNMTVEENLSMHGHFYQLPKSAMKERIEFVLKLVEMSEWKKEIVNSLSGGMRRRVEIARSLLHFPKVLFLDEPTSGLDPQTRANIWEYLVKLQKENKMTIFLTTHYMDEAEICDKVAIIDHGKIIAYDTPQALKEKYSRNQVLIIPQDGERLEKVLKQNNYQYGKRSNGDFSIEFTNFSDLGHFISEYSHYIKDIEMKKGSLNDVFLELTGRDIRGSIK